jgi:adenosine 3'-phospho 5'-phosphosulfate transporter B2
MVEPYGEGDAAETFKYSLFLVLCNRLTSCFVAIVSLVVRMVAPTLI